MIKTYVKSFLFVLILISLAIFCFQPSIVAADDIIDNGDFETSFTGTWAVSGGADPFGADSLWSRDGDTYTWSFTPTDSGYHEFSMWWTEWPSRSTAIPVDIEYWGGTDQIVIDQQVDGGQWNLLNTYPFEAGVSYDITITSQPGPASTNADAVQFIFRPDLNVPPVAVIDSITPSPAPLGADVTFVGHGDDLDGSIIGYSWDSSIDGHLGDSATFTTATPLSEGTHTISFTVIDDDGEMRTVSQILSVQAAVTEFIIDNGDPETSFVGSWSVSGAADYYGSDSLWARDGDTYTFTFTPLESANYSFYMWHTVWPSRSTSVPVSIGYLGGTDTVIVNQQINGGMWNLLGSYPFEAGVSYDITITSQPYPSSTCADAVRFVKEGSINVPPVASIDAITPTAALPGEMVTFEGSGSDTDGTVVEYEWYSDFDGVLSDQPTFSIDTLSLGTHTIFFRVQDDQGAWSQQEIKLVVVRDCDSPLAIMLLGNSITYGVGEIPTADQITGYRAPLFQSLKSAGYYFDFVGGRKTGLLVVPPYDIDHQGEPGISDDEVAVNVYDWLVENPAEIILLHIGTNYLTTDPGDVEDILNEIDRYEADYNVQITVVLAKIINRMTNHPETTTFNSNVESMALSRIATGDKIVIVDQESALDYPDDMWDSLHPRNSGYDKMAVVFLNGVIGLMPICADFPPFIFTSPIENALVGFPYTYTVGALGFPEPIYSLLSSPAGMTIDPVTGLISWTPGAGQQGDHAVTVQASSSQGSDTQSFTIGASSGIIIDNGDPETSFTGTWSVSGGPNPWDPADPDADSLWSRDGDTYTWTFTPTTGGDYTFSMWHTTWPSRSTAVPVTIEYAGGTDVVTINQQVNGNQWNVLGTYAFVAGTSYDITVTSQPGPASTCADAVKFEMAAPSPPSITSHPASQSVMQGSTATFNVTATGTGPLSYQWQKDSVNISGATGTSYTTPATTLADNGAEFRCVVTNTAGSATSNAAVLTVEPVIPPSLTSQPSNQSVPEGMTATFAVTATGSDPLNYQWQKNGVNIGGATGSAYTTPATTLADNGAEFRCVVTNPYGNATSNIAILTVNAAPPTIVTHPSDQSVAVGATATFNTVADGSPPLSYQWQKDGTNISGATSNSYTTPPVALADSGSQYRCLVSNVIGDITSNAATLTVIESEPPVAFNDTADTQMGQAASVNVVANDTASDGTIDPTSVSIIDLPSNGTAVPQGDGTVLYTPNAGFSGVDTFTYTVQNDQGVLSNTATVTITVGIIIDNGDPETSSTGTWSVSGAPDPWDPADPGATSLWARDGATYTWTFTPIVGGNYRISMWYTAWPSRASSIPVDIEFWGGTDTVNVNQQRDTAEWDTLGTYPFEAGVSYDITLNAVPGGSEGYSSCADAVQFVYIPTNVMPVATIDSISPEPALPGDTVSFSGSGIDFEGPISGYSWYSTLDGPLSDQASFSTSALSEGVHTIFFKVQDNNGSWSTEVQTSLDVNNSLVETTVHIYFASGYAPRDATPDMHAALQEIGATYSGGVWTYRNTTRNKRYIIHEVTTFPELINAFNTQDAVVLYNGHSNYGIGQLFATSQEWATAIIEEIRYVDDDRFLNSSSPIVHVNVNYMRNGQAYPHWWPIYKDGTSAIVPYDWGDPSGRDPAFNYYSTYQVPGDPIHYLVETVRSSAISRFPDSRVPAWYDPNGGLPDASNPDDLEYYITNSDPWSPSYERVGTWVDTNELSGYFRENYEYSNAGNGSNQAEFFFSIPEEADYNVYTWYPASTANATSAPFTINHASGSTTVTVNQRLNGGDWYNLGTYHFGIDDYSVVLTNNVGSGRVVADGIRVEHVDNPPEVLRAHFFATNRSGPAPLIVEFRSEPVGDVDTFEWNFGDGTTNHSRSLIEHTYTNSGTYTVSYTVNGPLGSDTTTEVGYVVVGVTEDPLQAEFESRSSQTGTAPRDIRFRDRTSGSIVSWEWDFDDNGVIDSTDQSPTFTYTTHGLYTVSLTVKDEDGNSNTKVKEDFIRITKFDTNIDNVDYPKTHYRSKTLLFRKELELNPDDFQYKRLFYGGCDTRVYYVDTFQRGIMHFSEGSSADGDIEMAEYLKAYVEGKSDYEIWQTLQAIEPLFDYFDFNKRPSEQW